MDYHVEKLKDQKNYQQWKFMMQMILTNEDLIDCIKSDDECKDNSKVQKALAKICLSVNPAVIPHICTAKTAYQAWSNLEKVYEPKGLIGRVDLLRQLPEARLGEAEEMATYLNRIISLGHQLADSGLPLDEEFMGVVILSGLTANYNPLIMALDISGNRLDTETLRSKLISEHRRLTQLPEHKDGINLQIKKQIHSHCFTCGVQGHWKRECPNNPKKHNECIRSVVNNGNLSALPTVNRKDWCVDLTTPHHMCCNRHMMIEMSGCTIQVKMADGRTVTAKGIGQSSFVHNGGTKREIGTVYYVPELSTNLLSVNALNRKGFKVIFADNICKILNAGNLEIVSASCVNGIYKLDTE